MSAVAIANPNEAWRNYRKQVSIGACKLRTGDLKRLYRLINEKQIEAGNNVLSGLWQTPQETVEQFQERYGRVKDAFVTTVQIKGFNAEVVTGIGEAFFDSPLLPERFSSIEYDTSFSVRAQLNATPNDSASVFLDFTRPRIFDRVLPSEPTPNKSNWVVSGQTEAWSTSLSTRLEQFFSERQTKVDWLHRSNTYDGLLIVMGLPLALWGAYRIGRPISARLHLPTAVETGLYVYAFFFSLGLFRWMFSYARWVFPKVELASEQSGAGKHRAVWATAAIGVLACAVWDAIKAMVG
jgi:hypothetical protein